MENDQTQNGAHAFSQNGPSEWKALLQKAIRRHGQVDEHVTNHRLDFETDPLTR
jgi:hypothetical protein